MHGHLNVKLLQRILINFAFFLSVYYFDVSNSMHLLELKLFVHGASRYNFDEFDVCVKKKLQHPI